MVEKYFILKGLTFLILYLFLTDIFTFLLGKLEVDK